MRLLKISLLIVLGLVLIVLGTVWSIFEASLPTIDGETHGHNISQTVTLERDDYGVVHVQGATQNDVMYGLGYAHAQDRWVQMDLLRRNAAGELSELFGKAALERDKSTRFHQFRARAALIYASLPAEQQLALQSYADGANAAVADFGARPFEYWLVGASIRPWQPEDSLLAIFSMYLDLQGGQVKRDLALTVIEQAYGAAMVDFIMQPSFAQAALDGSSYPTGTVPIPKLPKATATSFSDKTTNASTAPWLNAEFADKDADIGSNNWAVSARHTPDPFALLSNDMHLGMNVPAIWYKAQLSYGDVSVAGVSLPGAPGIVVGTNNHVAWGFTNANLDNVDWVALPDSVPTQTLEEIIVTPDGDTAFSIDMSEFGPVRTVQDQRYALVWVAHQPYATNFGLLNFAKARSLNELINIAQDVRIPVQNMMMADASGNIAYRPTGAVTARTPVQNTATSPLFYNDLWHQAEKELPVYRSPQYHKLWTANARVLSVDQINRFGDGGYALGVRGQQIAQRLKAQAQFDEDDFMALQLDNRAIFIRYWRDLLLSVLQTQPQEHIEAIDILSRWQACACPSSIGYTLARAFRSEVFNQVFAPLNATTEDHDVDFWPLNRHLEPALRQIISERPASWLPSQYASYDEFFVASFALSLQKLFRDSGSDDINDLTWGSMNALAVKHPLSSQLPLLSGLLDMPTVPGFGDSYMPAVQNGTHGASQRFIVAPGRWEDAIMSIPGGQSGHPLSDYYRKGFEVYAAHEKSPLLPGAPTHTMRLLPEADN
jgi:penicillin amidase